MNSYEMLGREKKVTRIVDALDVEMGHRCTEAELSNRLTVEWLAGILARAGVSRASQLTMDALVTRLRERDKMNGGGENG